MKPIPTNRLGCGARIAHGLALAAGMALSAGAALARENGVFVPDPFVYKNWELACDNTRTCRAAGYQAEDSEGPWVSLRITRAAGPNTPVTMTLQFNHDRSIPAGEKAHIKIGQVDLRDLVMGDDERADMAEFAPAQVRLALPELLKAAPTWADGKPDGTLSLAGATAVLLKMDELQGRLDTPSALGRRGNKSEDSALSPLPVPVAQVAAAAPAQPGDAALAVRIFPLLDLTNAKQDCNREEDVDVKNLQVNRLTSQTGDDMCRGFAGGAWQLSSYVVRVVPVKSADSQPSKP